MLEATTEFQFGRKRSTYKMANLSDELSELSHNELQFVIDGYFLCSYRKIKQRGISVRSWKAWRRAHGAPTGCPGVAARPHPTYCKTYPRITVEEQMEKMRELIAKARIR